MQIFNTIALSIATFLLAITPMRSFTEGVVGQPNSFFSNQAKTQHEHTVSHLIYRSLFKYDIYGAIIPDLAETWAVEEDGIAYTIKLKANQTWSDGSNITADDLIYTAFNTPDLAGVATDKVDDLTVRYTLPNKYSPFLSLLSGGVMRSGSVENEKALMPVSSGDWLIVSVEKIGKSVKQITLRTNSDKYKIKKIKFKYYTNEDELATAAKLGEISGFVSAKSFDINNFVDYQFPEQGIYYALYLNLNKDTLKDLTLRQKLKESLHIEEIIFDKGISVEGPISRSIFTDRNVVFNKYDPTLKAAFEDKTVTITVPDVPAHVETVERIKKIWEGTLGINVEIAKVPAVDMVNKVINDRNFEILFYGQEVGRDPDRYINWHSTQKVSPGLNLSGFEQVRSDRALEEGRKATDNDTRIIHYNEFQRTLNENVPAIFLYHPFVHYYVTKYVEGIGEKYTFTQYDRFLDFENWHWVETN
jgi:peptide/nickel transport system substrate-binding protein